MKKFGLVLLGLMLLVSCRDEYRNGWEEANYEITYQLTGKRDTIQIKTPIDAEFETSIDGYQQRYIFRKDGAPCRIYIHGEIYYGLEGLGTIKKLNVISVGDTVRMQCI